MTTSSETVYYQDPTVLVTSARVVLAGKTYALSNITSVAAHGVAPSSGCAFLLILFGLLIGLGSGVFLVAAMARAQGEYAFLGTSTVMGLLALGAGIVIQRSLKTSWVVRLGSASGETDALSSYDRAAIERVSAAISEAIVKRG